ncbi:MAG TPA: hypothetical protein VFL91_06400 [Thermomicrobiales bacterium]|nr:hypothetical protein [Thermomicrobiales bacterium]
MSANDDALLACLRWLRTPRRVPREGRPFGEAVAAAYVVAALAGALDTAGLADLIGWIAEHYPWRLERRRAEADVELVRFEQPTALQVDAIVRNWRAARFIEAGMGRMGDGQRRRRRVSSR